MGIRDWCLAAVCMGISATQSAAAPEAKKAASELIDAALRQAVRFFHSQVAHAGGYLWEYSGDLKLREAEGKVYDSRSWVQPPGTPTIGEAFLEAYEATGDPAALEAALDAAYALVDGQHRSGGWDYYITADPADRQPMRTCLDDDTTQAALRFLMRVDKLLGFKEQRIHEATLRGLDSLLRAQYPNGAWFVFWRKYPEPYDPNEYPVLKASYPDSWPRTPAGYPERPRICYILNDNLVPDVVRTLFDAWDIYSDPRYLGAAKKGAEFLLLAQMPDPQPGWAQAYDVRMQPVWGRKFEPPAISGWESQAVMESLLMVYRRTGDPKYLEPIPKALAYFRKSQLPDGRLARFYELKTNRPLYFTRKYELTYTSDDLPTHYMFICPSRLDAIEAECRRLATLEPAERSNPPMPDLAPLSAKAVQLAKALDGRGAWVERGPLRFHQVEPPSGVIKCRTFADNVHILSQYLILTRGPKADQRTTAEVAGRFAQTLAVRRQQAASARPLAPREQDRPGVRRDRPRQAVAREKDHPARAPEGTQDADRRGESPKDKEVAPRRARDADRVKTGLTEQDAARRDQTRSRYRIRDGERPRTGPRDPGPPRG